MSLEASKLLEVFQWSGKDLGIDGKVDKIKEDLADILTYCIMMADECGLDLDKILLEKNKVNSKKYPVEKAKGSNKKYNEL